MSHQFSRFTALFGLLAWAPLATAGGTLFVDAGLNTGLGDGSTWNDAFQGTDGLQSALALAAPGDQVFVADGTYRTTSTTTRTIAFALESGVEVYGSFLGGETSPDERPPFGTPTSILTGEIGNTGSVADNSHHVVNGQGTNATAILDGFFITGGNANITGGNRDRGGGILCSGGASPTVRNCHFEANRCTFGGGAGYINNGASPSFTDTAFVNNIGGAFGGAFDIAGGNGVRYERCLFEGNSAARAGALEIFSSSGIVVVNSIFQGNTATGGSGGGGLWIGQGGSTQVRNCTIYGNSSTAQAAGGIRVQGASPTIANCILWANTGPGGAQGAANQLGGGAATFSVVEGGLAGTGNSGLDPMFTNAAAGDFTLTAGSSAVDAGNNGSVPAGVTVDYAGNLRFADDLGTANTGMGSGALVDIGAFEKVDDACFSSVSNYCTSNPNSQGIAVAIASSGSPFIGDNNFTLVSAGGIPGGSGLYYYGQTQGSIPFGDGVRCIQGQTVRIGLVFSNFFGDTILPLDFTQPPFNSGPGQIVGGSTWNFQYWYRDTNAASGFNLSDGLEVSFCP